MTSEFTLTTASILADAAILLWPMPEDPFETALWAQNLEEASNCLSTYANRLFHEHVQTIYDEGMMSPAYGLSFRRLLSGR